MQKSLSIHIKNMVCPRCITVVKEVLHQNNVEIENVKLGIVHLSRPISNLQHDNIAIQLQAHGFEILEEKSDQIVDHIKTLLIDIIHYEKPVHNLKLSEFLSQEVKSDYSYLSKLFSQSEGTTIEQFFQKQKIEKVKELLSYNELSISEIAYKLDYSNPAHLSSQFKKITGLSPTVFKKLKIKPRNTLDII